MKIATTASRIIEIIAEEAQIPVEEIKMDSVLGTDIVLDSLQIVEITMQTEEEFGITLPDESVETRLTVRQFIELVEKSS